MRRRSAQVNKNQELALLFIADTHIDEIALYDRQIRLWGMTAQQKIRNANILLVTMKGLGNEIAKNLTLAGIASLTLHDNTPVTEDDLCTQFFLTEADKGRFVSSRLFAT